MQRWLVVGAVGFAACSFEPSGITLPTLGDDDDTPVDARAIDAPAVGPDAPPGCPDDDGDTICNSAERCPGHDDREDVDGDTTPDGCDDWNCGATRPTVTLPVSIGNGLTITATKIGLGGAVEELDRNTGSGFSVKYTWVDPDQGDRDQLELGVAGANRLNCRTPGGEVGGWTLPPIGFITGGTHRTVSLTAQLVHESNCASGPRDQGWANSAPEAPIIGIICVR